MSPEESELAEQKAFRLSMIESIAQEIFIRSSPLSGTYQEISKEAYEAAKAFVDYKFVEE